MADFFLQKPCYWGTRIFIKREESLVLIIFETIFEKIEIIETDNS